MVLRQGAGKPAAFAVMIVDEAEERRLKVVSEPAPGRVGPVEVPLDEPDGELLEDLVGLVAVPHGHEHIALNRPFVAFQKPALCFAALVVKLATLGIPNVRPVGRDIVQILVGEIGGHRPCLDAG